VPSGPPCLASPPWGRREPWVPPAPPPQVQEGVGVPGCARHTRLVFGMLYPAYASYKAVKAKNIREYVRWMMYWIVFALFMATETFTDLLISWFPFYYEVKMAFVLWLLSPYTRGASLLYRRFVHPTLARKEKVRAPGILGGSPVPILGRVSPLSWAGSAPARWQCPGRL
ncbi:receptor expression-enhancing protein 4-like, partial [Corapipo altera]|uniref:receptor expression-enhancing protein 4-like n=1 Tax=Corapipo altera TaxID=415028 RepID=UPI000FD6320E